MARLLSLLARVEDCTHAFGGVRVATRDHADTIPMENRLDPIGGFVVAELHTAVPPSPSRLMTALVHRQ